MLNKKALAASVSATVPKVYVEDVFSTYLYNGNAVSAGDTNVINNGIDLSGKGGMVWIKSRSATSAHPIFDTARGATKWITSSSTAVEATDATTLSSFNSNGFTVSTDSVVNDSGRIYASWTFRKQAKFFDVVTYTGNGTTQNIAHNLGSAPGCVIVKRTDLSANWFVWHRGLSAGYWLLLNSTQAQSNASSENVFGNNTTYVDPTSTVFTVGNGNAVNASGATYVAYLFAHDAGGFGANGTDNVISCGSYTGNGSATGPTIDLGWEPQWVLIKRASGVENWYLMDNMRGFIANGDIQRLYPNDSLAEDTGTILVAPTATGFKILTSDVSFNTSGNTYVYIAIRRGPMKTPTDATKVFTPTVYTGTNVDNRLVSTTIDPDFVMIRQRNDTVVPGMYTGARITGNQFLITGSTNAEAGDADSFDAQIISTVEYGNAFSSMSGVWVGNDATRKFNANTTTDNHIIEAFKRAPGFFDVVCYTGTGANRTVAHNLGVVPEMMWVKRRGAAQGWAVYSSAIGNTSYLQLSSNAAQASTTTHWNSTTPTSSVFTVGTDNDVNSSLNTGTYIAMLFASCPGVSKVGSYTGNGTNQTINCGFTAGARYVLIKRTDSTGDWFVYDSARGIVSGNDPQLKLNATTAEATGFDAIDPDNSGFIVNNDATNFPINVNNATYIYLAVA